MKPVIDSVPKARFPPREDMYSAIFSAFMECNEEIYSANYDIRFSGSTCVTVLCYGNRVICSNVGDSRALLVTYSDEQGLTSKPLSRDHKPD